MSIEFPLAYRQTLFGLLSDPKIPVTVRGPLKQRRYRFMVDTGARSVVASRRVAVEAGRNWRTLPPARLTGIEQGSIPARMGRLPIRVGPIDLTVRCLVVDNPRTPFVLGRADFFDRFVVIIDQPRRKIILIPE